MYQISVSELKNTINMIVNRECNHSIVLYLKKNERGVSVKYFVKTDSHTGKSADRQR